MSATPKRWRMNLNNRFTEFSLDDSSDADVTSIQSGATQPGPFDWEEWTTTGEQMTIPAIPFPPAHVFLPGELKQLHLFEARYLALFETVVVNYDKKCAHILIDAKRHAMAASGTIISIKSWRRLDVGVTLDVEGTGRFKVAKLKASAPFIRGDFSSVHDLPLDSAERLERARKLEASFWKNFQQVVSFSVKLNESPMRKKIDTASRTVADSDKSESVASTTGVSSIAEDNKLFLLSPAAKIQLFEQKLKQAASRAVNHRRLDFADDESDEMLALRIQALSFAGWDFFPSTPGDRQRAIEGRDSIERMQNVVQGLEKFSLQLAAKLALQDAFST